MKKINKKIYDVIRHDLAGDFSAPCPKYGDLDECNCLKLGEEVKAADKMNGKMLQDISKYRKALRDIKSYIPRNIEDPHQEMAAFAKQTAKDVLKGK